MADSLYQTISFFGVKGGIAGTLTEGTYIVVGVVALWLLINLNDCSGPRGGLTKTRLQRVVAFLFSFLAHTAGFVLFGVAALVATLLVAFSAHAGIAALGSIGLTARLLFSFIALLLAFAVINFPNPMHSLLALIGLFLQMVVVYIIEGAEFLGLVFLIVYVGAVAILFLFVIMLLNVKVLTSALAPVQRVIQAYAPTIGIALGLLLLTRNSYSFVWQILIDSSLASRFASTVDALIYYVNYGAADIMALATLYSDEVALFLLATAILLVAMIGAIVLATATLDEEEPLLSVR